MKPLTVYSASAGSGKTFTLTAYYIAQLLQDDDPNGFTHLMAVTFTVKATAEMKDRILGTLYNLSLIKREGIKEEELDGEMKSYLQAIANIIHSRPFTWQEVLEVSDKAALCLSSILRSYDRFRVTTIDSFFQGVLKGVAKELNLPANLRTEISDEEVRRLAVERLMDSLSSDQALNDQVWSYVYDRIANDKRWSVSAALRDFSQWLFKEEFGKHRRGVDKVLENNPNCLEEMRNELETIKGEAQKAMAKVVQPVMDYIKANGMLEEPLYRTDNGCRLDTIINRCNAMLSFEAELECGKTIPKYTAQPETLLTNKKGRAALVPQAAQLMALYDVVEKAYPAQLKDYNGATLAQANLHQLGLINAISKKVVEINEENGQFILSDTCVLLGALMGSGGNSDFVFEKIGPALEHIMIDEFQDTSQQQWSNFKPLFLELLSRHQPCLIVGDVKQSLYRWRNGDWKVLGEINQQVPEDYLSIESLAENYRSEKSIIDFNNLLFPALAKTLDGLCDNGQDTITKVYGDVQQHLPAFKQGKADNGLVRVKMLPNDDETTDVYEEMRHQMHLLHAQGVPYGDMAILVRSKTHTPDIIQGFRDDERFQGVKLVSSEAFMLQSSWAVRLVVAVLGCLANEQDSIDAAYCGLLGEEVDIPRFKEWERLPLQELNERIISQLHLGRYSDQVEYLTGYMDQVANYVQNNPADIASFLDYWKATLCVKTIVSTDAQAIPIVTIHASKGLAYDHVFIPNCDFPISKFYQDDINWVLSHGKGQPYEKLPVLPIGFHSSKKVQASIFEGEMQAERSMQLMDAINLVYVAFTRAKKSLYIWGQRDKSLSITSNISTAIDAVLSQQAQDHKRDDIFLFGTEQRAGFRKEAATAKSRIEPLFADTIGCTMAQGGYTPNYRQSTDALKLIGETASDLGDIIAEGSQMHDVLALVEVASDLESAIARYKNEAVLSPLAEKNLRTYFATGLRQEQVRDWFSGRYKVMNEQTIVVPPSEGLDTIMPRPDRVMVSDDKVVVVDYKFTKHSSMQHRQQQHEQYQRQVRAYMQVLAKLYPNKSIEGYLWFLKDNTIETI